ncbi:MAG: TlpA family protein disulfide reductase [Lachnospiraceae bacterium]|nr:TlpA family protein disulfide reductase [Lachnospiraceae bacterium]
MKKVKVLVIVSILFAVLLSGCGKSDENKIPENNSAEEEESTIPPETEETPAGIDFEGIDMDGNEVSSAVFSEAKLTMVNVWATYCNPCLSEMPGLGELAQEYDPEEFQIIGIISDVPEGSGQKEMELAADLIEQTGADYTHLLLNESIYFALLTDVSAVPTTFFVDENGVILDTIVGAMEKSAWEEKIGALLEE